MKLYLINGEDWYHVEVLSADRRVADAAFTLTKVEKDGSSGNEYTVHSDRHGTHCTCPDFVWRKNRNCKHITSLRETNLLKE